MAKRQKSTMRLRCCGLAGGGFDFGVGRTRRKDHGVGSVADVAHAVLSVRPPLAALSTLVSTSCLRSSQIVRDKSMNAGS